MNKIIAIQLDTINVNHSETREIEFLSNTTKNTKTEKQKQKRLVTTSKKWTFIESDYSKETQLSILTDIQNNTDNIKNDTLYSKIMASFVIYSPLYCRFSSIKKCLNLINNV